MEMMNTEIAERFMAMWSETNIKNIPKDKPLDKLPSFLEDDMLYVYSKTFMFGKILANMRKMFIQNGVKIFALDYLQLMKIPMGKMTKSDAI